MQRKKMHVRKRERGGRKEKKEKKGNVMKRAKMINSIVSETGII